MVRNDGKTVVFLLHAADKAAEKGFDQRFRLGAFTIFIAVDDGGYPVAVHDFLHLRRRNEIAFLRVDFKEAETFFGAFNDTFCAGSLRVELLFKLREQRIILEHSQFSFVA